MGLFNTADIAKINQAAKQSTLLAKPAKAKSKSINSELQAMTQSVVDYFKDSKAILIDSDEKLHNYVDACIESGYAGIDTETTGLDRIKDRVVGVSLYYPGGEECYIPSKHLIPIFEEPYKNQISYESISKALDRFTKSKIRLIFANADFDLSMIYKDFKADLCDNFFYDVLIAWRCLKEDELHNNLKALYNKYVLKGKGDPKRFSDFFTPELFPYCKPEVAKLYAGYDARITYELFKWQLPYCMKKHPKCQKANLEHIADLIWNLEFPMVKVCQMMHRRGVYIDQDVSSLISKRYDGEYKKEIVVLQNMVQDLIDNTIVTSSTKRPFMSGKDFNPNSTPHAKYLLYDLLKLPQTGKASTGKEVIAEVNLPVTNQILKVRSLKTLISTFTDKLPKSVAPDQRIHAHFKQIGANTGRMCIAEDTKITCLNGYKLIQDIKPGDLIYCYDEVSRELKLSKVKNIWKTGENKDCVEVKWQSSGKGDIGTLICTPEHPILLKTGEWVQAQHLNRYDKVVHLRRSPGRSKEPRPEFYGWDGLYIREQDIIRNQIFNCTDSGYVIHHKDGNYSNNDLSNLEILTVSDHTRLHVKKPIAEGTHKYKHLHSDQNLRKSLEVRAQKYVEKVTSPENICKLRSMIQDAQGRISYVPMDLESFKHQCDIAGIDIGFECAKFNSKYLYRNIDESKFIETYTQFKGDKCAIMEALRINEVTFVKHCDQYGISLNHMIQSVKPCGKYDVYDIEVEGYHNFIANEICVHNSSQAPNLQNIPSGADDIRHMFRATPEQHITIESNCIDDTIDFTLINTYSVKLSTGGYIKVRDLKIQDVIVVNKDKSICQLKIMNIVDDEAKDTRLITCESL